MVIFFGEIQSGGKFAQTQLMLESGILLEVEYLIIDWSSRLVSKFLHRDSKFVKSLCLLSNVGLDSHDVLVTREFRPTLWGKFVLIKGL